MENMINYPTPEKERREALLEEAEKKLDEGVKEKMDRYGEVMKTAVHDALLDFCRQDAEFAEAVAQGGSFKDCMDAVAKGVGVSISDLDAYRKAVQFYFPGAEIRCQMTVDLIGKAAGERDVEDAVPYKGKPGVILDLTDFL